jgi:hypothetical protein
VGAVWKRTSPPESMRATGSSDNGVDVYRRDGFVLGTQYAF